MLKSGKCRIFIHAYLMVMGGTAGDGKGEGERKVFLGADKRRTNSLERKTAGGRTEVRE